MLPFQAVPGWIPWTKVQPSGTCQRAPHPGLAPGGSFDDLRSGKENMEPNFFLIIRGFGATLCLVLHLRPVCHGRPYQGHKALDN